MLLQFSIYREKFFYVFFMAWYRNWLTYGNVFTDIPMVGQYAGWVGGVYSSWVYYLDCFYCNAKLYVDEGNDIIILFCEINIAYLTVFPLPWLNTSVQLFDSDHLIIYSVTWWSCIISTWLCYRTWKDAIREGKYACLSQWHGFPCCKR